MSQRHIGLQNLGTGPRRVAWTGAALLLALACAPASAGADGGSGPPEVIRIACKGWYSALRAAADVYQAKHPGVRVDFPHPPDGRLLLDGSVNLWATDAWLHSHLRKDEQERLARHRPKPDLKVLGYTPLVALVHPDNSVASLTMDQLRRLDKMRRLVPWRELDAPREGYVCRYVHQGPLTRAWALHYDEASGKSASPKSRRKPGPVPARTREEWRALSRERAKYRKSSRDKREVLAAVAQDPGALAIVLYDEQTASCGLRPVPLQADERTWRVEMTPAATVRGDYPARAVARLYVFGEASEAERAFVAWLASDAGRAVLAKHFVYSKGHAPDGAAPAPAVEMRPERAPWDGAIDGAVAVLPTKLVSPYFFLAGPEHQERYEARIVAALQEDGRLGLVDRAHLRKVLRERKGHLAAGEARAASGPIVAADVFVLPSVITREGAAYLRVLALHAATASVLGELRVRIDPAKPARFGTPLAETVARWWPGVLTSLHRARTQPRWHTFGVAADGVEQVAAAGAGARRIARVLGQRTDAFHIAGPVLTGTQHEAIMQILGFSRARAGGFTPLFDYVVQGRQLSPQRLRLIVRDGMFREVARTTVEADDAGERLARASAWLDAQVRRYRRRGPSELDDDARRRGARVQSRMAYLAAMELREDYEDYRDTITVWEPRGATTEEMLALARAADRRHRNGVRYWRYRLALDRLGVEPPVGAEAAPAPVPASFRRLARQWPLVAPRASWLTPAQLRELAERWRARAERARREYARQAQRVAAYKAAGMGRGASWRERAPGHERFAHVAAQYWRHLERAAQLDPTWDHAAYRLISGGSTVPRPARAAHSFGPLPAATEARLRFLAAFPDSPHREAVLYRLARGTAFYGEDIEQDYRLIPVPGERRRLRKAVRACGIDAYFTFLEDYVLPNKMTIPYMRGDVRFQHYGYLLRAIGLYVAQCDVSDAETAALVRRWSRAFDAHTDAAPHSDFVRLACLLGRGRQREALTLLRDLQRRWPRRSGLPWTCPAQGDTTDPIACVHRAVTFLLRRDRREPDYGRMLYEWIRGERALDDLPWMAEDFDLATWEKREAAAASKE